MQPSPRCTARDLRRPSSEPRSCKASKCPGRSGRSVTSPATEGKRARLSSPFLAALPKNGSFRSGPDRGSGAPSGVLRNSGAAPGRSCRSRSRDASPAMRRGPWELSFRGFRRGFPRVQEMSCKKLMEQFALGFRTSGHPHARVGSYYKL